MTFDEWEEKFKPQKNPFVACAPMNDCMLETYGEELAFVSESPDNVVWTLREGDEDDELYISAGAHFVNRLGYIITEVPWTAVDHAADILCD